MLLDICEVDAPAEPNGAAGRMLTMLVFSYRIGGVNYECSQDITSLSDVLVPANVRADSRALCATNRQSAKQHCGGRGSGPGFASGFLSFRSLKIPTRSI